MKIEDSQKKSVFLNALCGKFSNKIQADKDPRKYANINIYFRLLPWKVFNDIGLYSEQAYNHSPWCPYRQAVHRLTIKNNLIILENYKLTNPDRFAGGGFNLDLLSRIKKENLSLRKSCQMNFYKTNVGTFKGHLQQNSKHIIERDFKKTYLVSNVEFNMDTFISSDEGFDLKTNEKVWGAENGALKFKRVLETDN